MEVTEGLKPSDSVSTILHNAQAALDWAAYFAESTLCS
jgi:hypothetical protein